MTRLPVLFLALLVALVALLIAFPALSATPHLRTTLSADSIEVGDSAALVLVATPGDQVTEAQLPALPPGLALVGQNMSPSFQVTIVNGRMTQVTSARAVFRVRGAHEGTYTLPPPAVVSDGKRYVGDKVTLRVVPKGTLPRQQFNPFDPFNMFGQGNPIDDLQPQVIEPTYPTDPRYDLEHAHESGTFLHATVDKSKVVVGEQVTLSVYVYADVTQSDPELSDPHESGTSEFVRQSLLKPDAAVERTAFAHVAGKVHAVALIRKYALFPLHAGELEITPMRLHVTRLGERASETLSIHVTEPPMEHRPAGYTVGDVGRFTVTADVAPREVERGSAVAVNVELSGWGNLPTAITVPARPGVAWLDPEVRDDLHALDAKTAGAPDVWGGTRRFSYVVTPKKEGDLDLGEITVPFFDPRAHAYSVARVALGTIHVKPGAVTAPEESKLLANMPPLRSAMEGAHATGSHIADGNVFFGLLGMPTALFGIIVAVRRLARRLAERARERRASPIEDLKQRLRALDAAAEGDDGRAVDGASIRVLEAGATAHVGVNVRGVGGEAVVSVLERAGVEVETATELRELLETCAAARFSPDGVEVDDARKRARQVRRLLERLADGPKSEP
jgi:hypothetical protein